MSRLSFSRTLDTALDAIMAANMLFAVVIAFTAVIFRYVIGSSIVWAFELLLILLTYMTFIGCYAAMRRGAHLRVDVIVRMLPHVPHTLFFLLAQTMVLLVAAVMMWWGWEQFERFGSRRTTMLDIPRGYIYIIIPLSGLAMGLESIYRTIIGLRRALRGEPPEEFDRPEKSEETPSV